MIRRGRTALPILLLAGLAETPALLVAVGVVEGAPSAAGRLGQAAGLAVLGLAVTLVFLSSRLARLERPVGSDRLLAAHGLSGLLVVVLVLAHAVGVNTGGLVPPRPSAPAWALPLGQATLLVIVAGALLAILRNRLPLDYCTWRSAHRGLAVVVFLGAVHGLGLGRHLRGFPAYAIFLVLVAGVAALTVLRRIRSLNPGRRAYEVREVREAARGVTTLALRPAGPPMVPAPEPGQFAFLDLGAGPYAGEDHPFSFSAPAGPAGEVELTIKALGDFTAKVAAVKPGERVHLEGPFGRFGGDLEEAPALLFIAGGVGITPLMAMVTHLAAQGDPRRLCFLFAARSKEDVLFSARLAALPAAWRTQVVLSRPDDAWEGARGHVTEAFLREHAGDVLDDAWVYLCGPPPMMDAVTTALAAIGVTPDRIRSERFTLL